MWGGGLGPLNEDIFCQGGAKKEETGNSQDQNAQLSAAFLHRREFLLGAAAAAGAVFSFRSLRATCVLTVGDFALITSGQKNPRVPRNSSFPEALHQNLNRNSEERRRLRCSDACGFFLCDASEDKIRAQLRQAFQRR